MFEELKRPPLWGGLCQLATMRSLDADMGGGAADTVDHYVQKRPIEEDLGSAAHDDVGLPVRHIGVLARPISGFLRRGRVPQHKAGGSVIDDDVGRSRVLLSQPRPTLLRERREGKQGKGGEDESIELAHGELLCGVCHGVTAHYNYILKYRFVKFICHQTLTFI